MTRTLLIVLGVIWFAGQMALSLGDCSCDTTQANGLPRGVSETGRERW